MFDNKKQKTKSKSCPPTKKSRSINKNEDNDRDLHEAVPYIVKGTIAIKLLRREFVFFLKPFMINKLRFFIFFNPKDPSLYQEACPYYCRKKNSKRSYMKHFKNNNQYNTSPQSNKVASQSKGEKKSEFSVHNSHTNAPTYPIIITNLCIFYKFKPAFFNKGEMT